MADKVKVIAGDPAETPCFAFGTDIKNMIQIRCDGSVVIPDKVRESLDDASMEIWDEVAKYGLDLSTTCTQLHAERDELEHTINCMKIEQKNLTAKYNEACGLLQYFVDRVKAGSIRSRTTYLKFLNFLGRD